MHCRFILLLSIFIFSNIAESFSKIVETETDYYIINGYKNFKDICIQDERGLSSTSPYLFTYSPKSDTKNNSQIWQFISASSEDSTLYYIRNSRSKLYLSGDIVEDGRFFRFVSASKSEAKPFKIIPINNDQVLFSTTDKYGVNYYMHATDTTSVPNFRNERLCANTLFAWILQKYEEPTHIKSNIIPDNASESFRIIDKQIIFESKSGKIYDVNGNPANTKHKLSPGIYIIKDNQKTQKIIIQ